MILSCLMMVGVSVLPYGVLNGVMIMLKLLSVEKSSVIKNMTFSMTAQEIQNNLNLKNKGQAKLWRTSSGLLL